MNTLEVTYADKAGRLIDQSPDKKTIEDLKTAVQELQGKTLKIYYVEDAEIGHIDFAGIDGMLDALAAKEYHAVYVPFENLTYYVVYSSENILQLVTISSEELISVGYYLNEGQWTLDDSDTQTYTFQLTPVEPGTKLYKHTAHYTGSTDDKMIKYTTDLTQAPTNFQYSSLDFEIITDKSSATAYGANLIRGTVSVNKSNGPTANVLVPVLSIQNIGPGFIMYGETSSLGESVGPASIPAGYYKLANMITDNLTFTSTPL